MMNLSVKFWAKGLNLGRNFEKIKKFAFLLNFLNFLRSNPLKASLEFIILDYNACGKSMPNAHFYQQKPLRKAISKHKTILESFYGEAK